MRAVIQRVKESSVVINNKIYSSIGRGFLVLLGISKNDKEEDIDYIIDKILNLRIFNDKNGKMNENINSVNGELLIVSQFTLYGDARKGRRPSYSDAANGEKAIGIYNDFLEKLRQKYDKERIKTGIFASMMNVNLINDGPVTILLDSERKF
jgi:D-tyrosyl-tRNA(Tyr) deacylase